MNESLGVPPGAATAALVSYGIFNFCNCNPQWIPQDGTWTVTNLSPMVFRLYSRAWKGVKGFFPARIPRLSKISTLANSLESLENGRILPSSQETSQHNNRGRARNYSCWEPVHQEPSSELEGGDLLHIVFGKRFNRSLVRTRDCHRFEIAIKPSKLQKEQENPGQRHRPLSSSAQKKRYAPNPGSKEIRILHNESNTLRDILIDYGGRRQGKRITTRKANLLE